MDIRKKKGRLGTQLDQRAQNHQMRPPGVEIDQQFSCRLPFPPSLSISLFLPSLHPFPFNLPFIPSLLIFSFAVLTIFPPFPSVLSYLALRSQLPFLPSLPTFRSYLPLPAYPFPPIFPSPTHTIYPLSRSPLQAILWQIYHN
jgi:hypothetical protein